MSGQESATTQETQSAPVDIPSPKIVKDDGPNKVNVYHEGETVYEALFTLENLGIVMGTIVASIAITLGILKVIRPDIDYNDIYYDFQEKIGEMNIRQFLSELGPLFSPLMIFRKLHNLNDNQTNKDVKPYAWNEVVNTLHYSPEPGVTIADQAEIPEIPVDFTVHFNGDGVSEGIKISSKDYPSGLNEVIETTCKELIKEFDDNILNEDKCLTSNGARLFTTGGKRIYSFKDIANSDYKRTYIVPQGALFVYPLAKVGDVIIPETVESVVEGKKVILRQLSMSPRVFSVENFVSREEMDKIISHNKDLVKPSEVGFSGWRDATRTSQTAWDFTSWAAKKMQKRAFDLAGLPFHKEIADATQVLRYGNNEWYKPHTDWFDSKGYEGHDPLVNNGTNRFATVFVYLSDVEEGGETVFPLSKTHEGYNGEELVHKGTEKTAGYISDKDARWVCNSSSTALRTKPKAGDAVLFYSQGPRGELDKLSLHGGCPVISGLKWSANVWLWNRPKPSKDAAKEEDKKKHESYQKTGAANDDGQIHVTMQNTFPEKIKVYWDDGSEEMVFQMDIDPEESSPMQTYQGHRFVARGAKTGKVHGEYKGNPADNHHYVKFAH